MARLPRRGAIAVILAATVVTVIFLVTVIADPHPIAMTVEPQVGHFYVSQRTGTEYKFVGWPAARRTPHGDICLIPFRCNNRPVMMSDKDVRKIAEKIHQIEPSKNPKPEFGSEWQSSFLVEAKVRFVDGDRSWDGRKYVGDPYYRVEILELRNANRAVLAPRGLLGVYIAFEIGSSVRVVGRLGGSLNFRSPRITRGLLAASTLNALSLSRMRVA